MNDSDIDRISAWGTRRGLEGASETELLDGFCDRCRATGLELSRGMAIGDTLHPVYEGRAFRWRADGQEEKAVVEFGPSNVGENAENWRGRAFSPPVGTGRHRPR